MARRFVLLLLVAYSTCMKMRETVERRVMVRTTGSDLQPAATGFIYKKESDGPASVVKIGESEVMEHLTKLYEQPKSFAAPIPVAAGPFYAKDEEVLPADSESKVIPVVEAQANDQEHIAGIVDEDYEKVLNDYESKFGNYKSDFDDYLKSLGYSEDDDYSGHGVGDHEGLKHQNEYGDNDRKEYGSQHKYKRGGSADYDSAIYESYATSESTQKKGKENIGDLGDQYTSHAYKSKFPIQKAGNDQGEAGDGYHNVFDKNEYEKDNEFYDGEAIRSGLHKVADGHSYYGSDARGGEKAVDGESRLQEAGGIEGEGFYVKQLAGQRAGPAAHSSAEDEPAGHRHGNLGSDLGSSYYYKVTH